MKVQERFPQIFSYTNGIYLLICFVPFMPIIFKSLLKEESHNIAIVIFLNAICLYGCAWGLDLLARLLYRKVQIFQSWSCLDRKGMLGKLLMATLPFVILCVMSSFGLFIGQMMYTYMQALGFSDWRAWGFLLFIDLSLIVYSLVAMIGFTLLEVTFVGGFRLYYRSRQKG